MSLIRVSWAEAMQAEPGRFHVTEHWLTTTPEYVGIYFTMRQEDTDAIAHGHVTLLHGEAGTQVCVVKAKTIRNLTETVDASMSTWSKVSPGYPVLFALTDVIGIELIEGVVHRAIITVHKDSWLHSMLSKCRQLAGLVHGVQEPYRTNFHISIEKVGRQRRPSGRR